MSKLESQTARADGTPKCEMVDGVIEAAYEKACVDHFIAQRCGNPEAQAKYQAAADALEDAYPDRIEAMRTARGIPNAE